MSKSLADNPFITEAKDKNGDSWYHQIVLELKDKEIERLNNIIKLKTDFIAELLKIILVARDYELHEKCEVRAKLYEEKLQELKGSDKE